MNFLFSQDRSRYVKQITVEPAIIELIHILVDSTIRLEFEMSSVSQAIFFFKVLFIYVDFNFTFPWFFLNCEFAFKFLSGKCSF